MKMILYCYVLLVLGYQQILRCVKKYAKLQDVLFNGSKLKLLVYNKKGADLHFKINDTDVSIYEKTIHLGNVFSRTNKYEMVFDCIKKFNCSVNRFLSEFGSLQTLVKKQIISSVLLCIVRISTMATVA